MSIAVKAFFSTLITPASWTGPVFGKELRVSSRRKRNYLLRFLYLFFLTIFVMIAWSSAVDSVSISGVSAAYVTSRMAAAGTAIVSTIIIFQFIATQVVAVIMLSTSISDEIYNKTLGALMSTPVNSFQIVTGKLLSKLLQVIILTAITMPLLAVVRVFGGVPWGYILSSLCVTATAVIFAGSMSMYFSISVRRAYEVILKTAFALVVLYSFVPGVLALLVVRNINFATPLLVGVIMLTNPFFVMQAKTAAVTGTGGMPMGGALPSYVWWVHCLIMLTVSAVVLGRCVKIVRRVALRQATGAAEAIGSRGRRKRKKGKTSRARLQRTELSGVIRPITGHPVVWKELRTPLVQGGRKQGVIAATMAVIALLITYLICIRERCLHQEFCHVTYTIVFMILGLIANMVLAATTISAERESRCWPLLMATSMDDMEILVGKAVGILRRCIPIWSLLAGHVLLFVMVRYIHPIAIVHLVLVVSWAIIFLTGAGLYFSTICRRSTSAVVSTVALAILLWMVVPMLLGMVSPITDSDQPFLFYVSMNPVVQAGVVMAGAGGESNAHVACSYLKYEWPVGRMLERCGPTTLMVLGTTVMYVSFGLLFAWRAKCRFRRKVF